MKLIEALKAMKPMIKDSVANYAGLVGFDDDHLRAYDGISSIEIKVDGLQGSWAVDAAKLTTCLSDESEIKVTETHLAVKTGKSNFRLKLLGSVEVPRLDHAVADLPMTDEAWQVLRLASQFKSPHAVYPWASCIYVRDRRAYVTNNIAAVVFDIPLEGTGMIPCSAIETIGSKCPDSYHVSEHCIVFERGDVSLRCALPDAAPPEVFFSKLNEIGTADTAIAEGLSEAIQSAVTIDGRTVTISPDSVRARSAVGDEVEVPIATNTTKDVNFDPRYLLPVMGIANAIDWANYPAAVVFSGAGVRGILAGRA